MENEPLKTQEMFSSESGTFPGDRAISRELSGRKDAEVGRENPALQRPSESRVWSVIKRRGLVHVGRLKMIANEMDPDIDGPLSGDLYEIVHWLEDLLEAIA